MYTLTIYTYKSRAAPAQQAPATRHSFQYWAWKASTDMIGLLAGDTISKICNIDIDYFGPHEFCS